MKEMLRKMRAALVCALCCLVLLALDGCGNSVPVSSNQQTTASTNQSANSNSQGTQSAHAPAVAASPKSATLSAASGGDPVDTSKYDAEIKRLEERAKKSPADRQTRLALAKAYTERGDALTGVRQYRAALGDYRRALRNDPGNEQAQQMSGTIISILKSMGRDVPPAGQEPTPLPLKQ